MKKYLILVLMVFVCAGCFATGPKGAESPEQLLELYKTYHAKGDINNLMRLYYAGDVTGFVKRSQEEAVQSSFKQKIVDAWVDEFSDETKAEIYKSLYVNGQTITFSLPFEGQIVVKLDSAGGNGLETEMLMYGEMDDRYYFCMQGFQ